MATSLGQLLVGWGYTLVMRETLQTAAEQWELFWLKASL